MITGSHRKKVLRKLARASLVEKLRNNINKPQDSVGTEEVSTGSTGFCQLEEVCPHCKTVSISTFRDKRNPARSLRMHKNHCKRKYAKENV
jgi:hypothetical protein